MLELLVSCKHRVPRYCLTNAKVQIKQYGGSDLYYATSSEIDWFGCSKNHKQPADCIIDVLQANACYQISIKPVE